MKYVSLELRNPRIEPLVKEIEEGASSTATKFATAKRLLATMLVLPESDLEISQATYNRINAQLPALAEAVEQQREWWKKAVDEIPEGDALRTNISKAIRSLVNLKAKYPEIARILPSNHSTDIGLVDQLRAAFTDPTKKEDRESLKEKLLAVKGNKLKEAKESDGKQKLTKLTAALVASLLVDDERVGTNNYDEIKGQIEALIALQASEVAPPLAPAQDAPLFPEIPMEKFPVLEGLQMDLQKLSELVASLKEEGKEETEAQKKAAQILLQVKGFEERRKAIDDQISAFNLSLNTTEKRKDGELPITSSNIRLLDAAHKDREDLENSVIKFRQEDKSVRDLPLIIDALERQSRVKNLRELLDLWKDKAEKDLPEDEVSPLSRAKGVLKKAEERAQKLALATVVHDEAADEDENLDKEVRDAIKELEDLRKESDVADIRDMLDSVERQKGESPDLDVVAIANKFKPKGRDGERYFDEEAFKRASSFELEDANKTLKRKKIKVVEEQATTAVTHTMTRIPLAEQEIALLGAIPAKIARVKELIEQYEEERQKYEVYSNTSVPWQRIQQTTSGGPIEAGKPAAKICEEIDGRLKDLNYAKEKIGAKISKANALIDQHLKELPSDIARHTRSEEEARKDYEELKRKAQAFADELDHNITNLEREQAKLVESHRNSPEPKQKNDFRDRAATQERIALLRDNYEKRSQWWAKEIKILTDEVGSERGAAQATPVKKAQPFSVLLRDSLVTAIAEKVPEVTGIDNVFWPTGRRFTPEGHLRKSTIALSPTIPAMIREKGKGDSDEIRQKAYTAFQAAAQNPQLHPGYLDAIKAYEKNQNDDTALAVVQQLGRMAAVDILGAESEILGGDTFTVVGEVLVLDGSYSYAKAKAYEMFERHPLLAKKFKYVAPSRAVEEHVSRGIQTSQKPKPTPAWLEPAQGWWEDAVKALKPQALGKAADPLLETIERALGSIASDEQLKVAGEFPAIPAKLNLDLLKPFRTAVDAASQDHPTKNGLQLIIANHLALAEREASPARKKGHYLVVAAACLAVDDTKDEYEKALGVIRDISAAEILPEKIQILPWWMEEMHQLQYPETLIALGNVDTEKPALGLSKKDDKPLDEPLVRKNRDFLKENDELLKKNMAYRIALGKGAADLLLDARDKVGAAELFEDSEIKAKDQTLPITADMVGILRYDDEPAKTEIRGAAVRNLKEKLEVTCSAYVMAKQAYTHHQKMRAAKDSNQSTFKAGDGDDELVYDMPKKQSTEPDDGAIKADIPAGFLAAASRLAAMRLFLADGPDEASENAPSYKKLKEEIFEVLKEHDHLRDEPIYAKADPSADELVEEDRWYRAALDELANPANSSRARQIGVALTQVAKDAAQDQFNLWAGDFAPLFETKKPLEIVKQVRDQVIPPEKVDRIEAKTQVMKKMVDDVSKYLKMIAEEGENAITENKKSEAYAMAAASCLMGAPDRVLYDEVMSQWQAFEKSKAAPLPPPPPPPPAYEQLDNSWYENKIKELKKEDQQIAEVLGAILPALLKETAEYKPLKDVILGDGPVAADIAIIVPLRKANWKDTDPQKEAKKELGRTHPQLVIDLEDIAKDTKNPIADRIQAREKALLHSLIIDKTDRHFEKHLKNLKELYSERDKPETPPATPFDWYSDAIQRVKDAGFEVPMNAAVAWIMKYTSYLTYYRAGETPATIDSIIELRAAAQPRKAKILSENANIDVIDVTKYANEKRDEGNLALEMNALQFLMAYCLIGDADQTRFEEAFERCRQIKHKQDLAALRPDDAPGWWEHAAEELIEDDSLGKADRVKGAFRHLSQASTITELIVDKDPLSVITVLRSPLKLITAKEVNEIKVEAEDETKPLKEQIKNTAKLMAALLLYDDDEEEFYKASEKLDDLIIQEQEEKKALVRRKTIPITFVAQPAAAPAQTDIGAVLRRRYANSVGTTASIGGLREDKTIFLHEVQKSALKSSSSGVGVNEVIKTLYKIHKKQDITPSEFDRCKEWLKERGGSTVLKNLKDENEAEWRHQLEFVAGNVARVSNFFSKVHQKPNGQLSFESSVDDNEVAKVLRQAVSPKSAATAAHAQPFVDAGKRFIPVAHGGKSG